MSKNQKIWFSVFLAMFLVPEILLGGVRYVIFKMISSFSWSDLLILGLIQPLNNNFITFFIILTEFIGSIGIMFYLYKINFRIKFIKIILLAISILLVYSSAVMVSIGFQLLSGSPQIG